MDTATHRLSAPVAPTRNRDAGQAVVEYYNQCRDDYRILWRTEENGSIHFGFFDDVSRSGGPAAVAEWTAAAATYGLGLILSVGAMGAAMTRTAVGRETAVRWLRIAARGRASRHDAAQRRMTEVCADAVGLGPGERVLDAGCGVAGTGLWLASHRGVTVLGLNLQPHQLREARRRAAADPAGARVRFSVQDYTEMGVADASVDVVWALESICHCLDKRAFIREAYRVLKPGGRLMMADFLLPHASVSADSEAAIRTWTRGWAIPNLTSVPAFTSDLAAHGFTNIRYRDIRQHVLPSSRRLHKASLVALPVDGVLQLLGARSAIQRENVRAAYWQYPTLRHGAWTYGIFVAVK
jgi:tocopherol O-methyltransferase